MPTLKVGNKAPDFSLLSNRGTEFKLSEQRGKNVIVFFYPMDESPVCSREGEAFKQKYSEFKNSNAEVVGISSQSAESHRSFASKHSLPFPLLSDPNGAIRKLYGVSSMLGVPGRVTFVVNKDRVIVFVYSSQIHPARHAQEALAALKNT